MKSVSKTTKIAVGAAILAVGGFSGIGLANAAQVSNTQQAEVSNATPATPAVPAVPEVLEVSHFEFQRYSWTGGPVESAPTEIPPSANWQAN